MLKSLKYLVLKSQKSVKTVVKLNKTNPNIGFKRLTFTSMMSSNNVKTGEQNKSEEKLLKSANDRLEYKYIVLNNGLKALLVSDPTFANLDNTSNETKSDLSDSEEDISDSDLTDVSSCDEKDDTIQEEGIPIQDKSFHSNSRNEAKNKKSATNEKFSAVVVCVRTGSFADPKQVQGLAHLVEHVLTMGSEEYPEENALDDFLSSRGGFQNAHTEYEYTMFEVEVHRKHLYGALQRLAHCFIHPLLRNDSIEREIKPVDTEFTEALPDDDVRLEQVFNGLANEGHPFNAFPWGNAVSLKTIPETNGTDTQKCVKEFVNKHYFSDNIHVVIQSQESIETLEKWVSELFAQIKPLVSNNEIQQNSKPIESQFGKPFDNNPNFNKLYFIEPVNETDQLYVMWCLPPLTAHYKTSPLDYLGNIVGHEGKGSLITFLRKENLALELVGGVEDSGFANNKYSSVFTIAIKLTDLGNKCIDKVVEYLFEYLNVLQTVGPQEWFFEELQKIERNRFNWQEEQSAINYVKKLANNMNNYPIEYILCGNKLYFDYNKQLIQSYLNLLTPNNASFVRLCTNILKEEDKDVKTEKWFGTRYRVNEVPKKWLSLNKWDNTIQSKRFHFPNPNPFIATDFAIKESSGETKPTKVLDKSRVKLWYKSDNKFKLPKAIIKLHLVSPFVSDSVQNAVMTDLFVEILLQNLSEDLYDATLAGLFWSLSQTNSGIVVSVGGFNDKLNVLLQTVLNKMINFEVEDKVYNDVKKNLSKGYHNSFIDPSNLNKSLRLTILSHKYFNPVDRRAILHSIDKQTLKTYIKKFFSHFYIEALIQGNLTKQESIDLFNEIESKLGIESQSKSLKEPELRTMQLPGGHDYCRVISLSTSNKNSSITNYYQLNPADIHLQCKLSVLSSLMDEPCFNILRTKEGLGYFVSTTDYDTYGISGFGISVNSSGNEFNCSFVDQRIENFITQMIDIISNMKEEKFKEHITSIITAKRVPDLQLLEEFNRNWNEIISFNYCFDRLEKEIKCLEKIIFVEFKEWAINGILKSNGNQKKRKLSVQIVGYGKKSLPECLTFDGKGLDLENQTNDQQSNEVEESDHNFKKFKLTFLKSKYLDNNQMNFIDDIVRYKEKLDVFPAHKVIE